MDQKTRIKCLGIETVRGGTETQRFQHQPKHSGVSKRSIEIPLVSRHQSIKAQRQFGAADGELKVWGGGYLNEVFSFEI